MRLHPRPFILGIGIIPQWPRRLDLLATQLPPIASSSIKAYRGVASSPPSITTPSPPVAMTPTPALVIILTIVTPLCSTGATPHASHRHIHHHLISLDAQVEPWLYHLQIHHLLRPLRIPPSLTAGEWISISYSFMGSWIQTSPLHLVRLQHHHLSSPVAMTTSPLLLPRSAWLHSPSLLLLAY